MLFIPWMCRHLCTSPSCWNNPVNPSVKGTMLLLNYLFIYYLGEYFICISIWHNASKWAKSSYESLPDVSSLVTVCGLTCVHTHSYELVLLIISKSSGCFDMVSASHLFGCNIIYIDSSANWYTLLTNVTILQWCSSAKVSPSISQSP